MMIVRRLAGSSTQGIAVCADALALPVHETDDRVLTIIEGEVLTPAFIEVVLNTVFVSLGLPRPRPRSGGGGSLTADRQSDGCDQDGRQHSCIGCEPEGHAGAAGAGPSSLGTCEAADRAQLRAAPEQRVSDWRQISK